MNNNLINSIAAILFELECEIEDAYEFGTCTCDGQFDDCWCRTYDWESFGKRRRAKEAEYRHLKHALAAEIDWECREANKWLEYDALELAP